MLWCNICFHAAISLATEAGALDLELVISLKINLSSRNLPRDPAAAFLTLARNLEIYDGLHCHNFHSPTASPAFSRNRVSSRFGRSAKEVHRRFISVRTTDMEKTLLQKCISMCTCRQTKRFVLRESLRHKL